MLRWLYENKVLPGERMHVDTEDGLEPFVANRVWRLVAVTSLPC